MADFESLIEDDSDFVVGPVHEGDLSDLEELTEHDRAKLLRRISKVTGKSGR